MLITFKGNTAADKWKDVKIAGTLGALISSTSFELRLPTGELFLYGN